MSDNLRFDADKYEVKTCELDGRSIIYRAFEGIDYCANPVDPIQKLNLFVPEIYYREYGLNGYTLQTAPIFVSNTVGGYMPGPADIPGKDSKGEPNTVFRALERIITNGTSAGGALSALAGATGNSPDYVPYLTAIGAADERDDIFAANCYCPIHNLENADAAYEWLFSGCNEFSSRTFVNADDKILKTTVTKKLTEKQIALSRELKNLFPTYLNSLHLTDSAGNPLTLDENGEGSFQEHIRSYILKSAQKELDTHDSANRLGMLAVRGSEVEKQSCLTIEDGKVVALDWDGFVKTITRMKPVPSFDALDLSSPENEEFGTEKVSAKHFTVFGLENSEVMGDLADAQTIKLLNPTKYIGKADTAKHWRIRHGAFDRDTSLAIPVILATLLENKGYDVDFFLPWGLPYSGDYDLGDLFAWIDKICT